MGNPMQDAAAPQQVESTGIKLNDAIEKAKEWLISTMSGEKISNLGLEEVEHRNGYWYITLGFSRPWDESQTAFTVLSGSIVMRRTFKIVTITEKSGEIISMKNREAD